MKKKRVLQLDIDGVLANFNLAMLKLVEQRYGEPLKGFTFDRWDWPNSLPPKARSIFANVWNDVTTDPGFWSSLPIYADAFALIPELRQICKENEVYFVTKRPAKMRDASAYWIERFIPGRATVIVTDDKASIAYGIKPAAVMDDHFGFLTPIYQIFNKHCAPIPKLYLIDRPWNQDAVLTMSYERLTLEGYCARILDWSNEGR